MATAIENMEREHDRVDAIIATLREKYPPRIAKLLHEKLLQIQRNVIGQLLNPDYIADPGVRRGYWRMYREDDEQFLLEIAHYEPTDEEKMRIEVEWQLWRGW